LQKYNDYQYLSDNNKWSGKYFKKAIQTNGQLEIAIYLLYIRDRQCKGFLGMYWKQENSQRFFLTG